MIRTSVCPVCHIQFEQPIRKQGGGRLSIYCSHKCGALDWARGNGGKRKASVQKYANKEEVKLKRKQYARNKLLQQYSWNEIDFNKQLQRQHYACYGCASSLDSTTAKIDHNHKTGEVRGLLCNTCNLLLGAVDDNPMTLRRLIAYLDYKIKKTCVYLIGSLQNKRVIDIGNLLRHEGYDVMDEWIAPGEMADIRWQEYEQSRGRTYVEALRGRHATDVFMFDRAYLDHCDIAIAVMPAGKSAMLELGYSKGRGKLTCIFLDGVEPDRYDIMPNFADYMALTEQTLLDWCQANRLDKRS